MTVRRTISVWKRLIGPALPKIRFPAFEGNLGMTPQVFSSANRKTGTMFPAFALGCDNLRAASELRSALLLSRP